MRLGDIININNMRVLPNDNNAYVYHNNRCKQSMAKVQSINKVVFPEAYSNAEKYYDKTQFYVPQGSENNAHDNKVKQSPMFDIKALIPMLMGGKFNDLIAPLMSMIGGKSKGIDIAKIFELFKTKPSNKNEKQERKESEDISSKFDDMIIIED